MELINLTKTELENGKVLYEFVDNDTGETVSKEVEIFDMEELTTKVSEWGADKGFVRPENALAQYAKFSEESGELAGGLVRKDASVIIDAIGDTYVTLILLSDMLGISSQEALSFAYSEIANRKGIEVGGVFVKASDFEAMDWEQIESMGVTKEQLEAIGIKK